MRTLALIATLLCLMCLGSGALAADAVEGFDPAPAWQTENVRMDYARTGIAAFSYKGSIYLLGGTGNELLGPEKSRFVVSKYVPGSGSISPMGEAPVALEGTAAVVANKKAYVFGSAPGSNKFFIFDFRRNTWQAGPDMPEPSAYQSAAVVGSRIYLIGGTLTPNSLFIYDLESGTWSKGADIPGAGMPSSSAAVYGTNIYVFGRFAYSYDTLNDTWTGLVQPRSFFYFDTTSARLFPIIAGGTASVAIGNSIVVMGGYDERLRRAHNMCEIYLPQENMWKSCPPLSTPRAYFGAAYENGRLFIMGGTGENNKPNEFIESLRPKTPQTLP